MVPGFAGSTIVSKSWLSKNKLHWALDVLWSRIGYQTAKAGLLKEARLFFVAVSGGGTEVIFLQLVAVATHTTLARRMGHPNYEESGE